MPDEKNNGEPKQYHLADGMFVGISKLGTQLITLPDRDEIVIADPRLAEVCDKLTLGWDMEGWEDFVPRMLEDGGIAEGPHDADPVLRDRLYDLDQRFLPGYWDSLSARAKEVYEKIEAVSVDEGIMEKAKNVVVLPIDVDWNDVGSWASVEEIWDRDKASNVGRGDVVSIASTNYTVWSPHRVTTLIGIEDVIVVDTPDALMICKKERAQEVKALLDELKGKGHEHLL